MRHDLSPLAKDTSNTSLDIPPQYSSASGSQCAYIGHAIYREKSWSWRDLAYENVRNYIEVIITLSIHAQISQYYAGSNCKVLLGL